VPAVIPLIESMTMNLNATPLLAPISAPDTAYPDRERRAFWHHYDHWVRGASDAELSQLQSAVGGYGTTNVRSLASIVRDVLQDEDEGRGFPASFLARLKAAHWPHANARTRLN
jgi:hypothetical protein